MDCSIEPGRELPLLPQLGTSNSDSYKQLCCQWHSVLSDVNSYYVSADGSIT